MHAVIINLRHKLTNQIIGQQTLVDRLLISLLADGHLLVEGAPGLAKTRAIKTLASLVQAQFQRLQFTPDLLPADITGTEVYNAKTSSFSIKQGPIFHNLVLVDEINRAPAKVQSALLEAMEERQVSIGGHTFALPELFLVMATQNPIENEGTYPLPEAQLDRFLLKVVVDYPPQECEMQILQLVRKELLDKQQDAPTPKAELMSQDMLLQARKQAMEVHMATNVQEYIVQLVIATRQAQVYDAELGSWIEYGASPRGTIALDKCARAYAWLQGRDFVSPGDVQQVASEVLAHRIITSLTASINQISPTTIITRLLEKVPVT